MGTDDLTVERRVGRLLEIRCIGTLDQLRAEALARLLAKIGTDSSGKLLTIADARRMDLTSDPIAQNLIELMLVQNSRTERAAYLLGSRSLPSVQLEAIILRARNPDRCVFRDRLELVRWLGEVATPAEIDRMSSFIDEGDAPIV